MMSFRVIWWSVEFIHFILGSFGFLWAKPTVVDSYSLYPKVQSNIKTFEMMRVSAVFYMSFALLSFLNIFYDKLNVFSSLLYGQFYATFLMFDMYDMVTMGYSSNKSRYVDTLVHLLFGLAHLYLFMY